MTDIPSTIEIRDAVNFTIATIHEQRAEIERLRAQLAVLKSKLKELSEGET